MPIRVGVDSRRAACAVYAIVLTMTGLVPARASGQTAEPVVPRRPLGASVPTYQPAPGEQERREAPPLDNPSGAVTLRDALALALLHNPSLASHAWETRAREARILQAGVLPNPSLNFIAEDYGARHLAGGGLNEPVQPQATIQLSQLIELGGKRAARRQLATAARDLAAWDYETARIDVLTEVTRAFTEVLAAQETVALADETTRLVDQVQQSVAARVQAGAVSPIEDTRAAVALANVKVEASRARRVLDASRTRLALLWGSPAPAFKAVTGDLKGAPTVLPPLADLTSRLQQNPEFARWAAEMAQREAALRVERARAVPDLTVTAGYRRFTEVDANALVAGVSVPLPFFDRNRGAIEEARSRAAKAYEEQRAAQARVTSALASAYAGLAAAHDEVELLRSSVLPGSQQTFDAITEGYRLGKFGIVDVLDAQRTLIAAGSQHLRALAEYQKAVADVERLTGAPLAGSTDLPSFAKE